MINQLISNKKLLKLLSTSKDFMFNILASLISTGVLQFIVYPSFAKIFHVSLYGQLLTIVGIVNAISLSFGNILNNTRLIQNSEYEEENISGDFNVILSVVNIIGFMIIIIVGNMLFSFSVTINFLLGIYTILLIIKSYLIVAYRLILDFKLNLYNNIFTVFGYLIGIYITGKTLLWPLTFILGELISIIFLFYTTDLIKEPFKLTKLFKKTKNKYIILILTGLIGNSLVYLDRLIIYPLLGGVAVSIYTVASLFGKTLGIVLGPISGVLLGYYSKSDFNMTKKTFWFLNFSTIILSILFFGFAMGVGPWFTEILYPSLIEEAKPYMFYANLVAVIGAASNMIQPAVLKFAPTQWQFVKEVTFGIIYVVLGIVLGTEYGLIGFCIAGIIANLFKTIFLLAVGSKYIKP